MFNGLHSDKTQERYAAVPYILNVDEAVFGQIEARCLPIGSDGSCTRPCAIDNCYCTKMSRVVNLCVHYCCTHMGVSKFSEPLYLGVVE